MEDLRTDDEQVEALKRWLKEYGRSVVVGVAVSLALIFGWRAWLGHTASLRQSASSDFDTLYQAFEQAQSDQSSELAMSTVETTAEPLFSRWSDTAYADLSRLLVARLYVEHQEYAKARELLEKVVAGNRDKAVVGLATIRLAKVLSVLEAYDEALDLMADVASDHPMRVEFLSVKGDILLAKGDRDAARSAYQAAVDASEENQIPFLEMKLFDLAKGPDSKALN